MIVSFEGGPFEVKIGLTVVSTCWIWSGVDLEGLSSMIGASTDNKGVSLVFSTSDGLGKSFLYQRWSPCGEARWLSKTLLALSKKGQWWRAWSPSHNLQGNIDLPFYPLTLFSLMVCSQHDRQRLKTPDCASGETSPLRSTGCKDNLDDSGLLCKWHMEI